MSTIAQSSEKSPCYRPQWSIVYDFHTLPGCPDVGREFDAEKFADSVKSCGVDSIVFNSRCNLGMAYYDTKVGIRHPSLEYDLLKRVVEACRKQDIKVTAYINVGLSHEEGLLHRDWLTLRPDGMVYAAKKCDHFFRTMCYNTGYHEHVLAMIRELVSDYDVAGIFCDCMGYRPCVGAECVREMKARGMDWQDPAQQLEFARLSTHRMAEDIRNLVLGIKPGMLLYFNGIDFRVQNRLATYFECEFLPPAWGYEGVPMFARHLRKYGKHLINMTGRFHKCWGDFGGLRSFASLEYDCLNGLMNGLRPSVGDHLHPRGDLQQPVFDLIGGVFRKLRPFDPWFRDAVPLTDIAFAAPAVPGRNEFGMAALEGASRLLCELKCQFDIVTPDMDWSGYRTLIVAEDYHADPVLLEKVKAHLAAGGTLIASGEALLDKTSGRFSPDELGIDYVGPDDSDPSYFTVTDAHLKSGVPDMPLNVYEKALKVRARPGASVAAELIAPYYNRRFDGEHYFGYQPPDRPTGFPAAVATPKTFYFSYPVFAAYRHSAPVYLKQLFAHALGLLLPEPLLRTENLPSFARATVTSQPGLRMVHILAFVPEKRGDQEVIEESITLNRTEISLRTDGHLVVRVYLAPDRRPLPFEEKDGYVKTVIPSLDGYAMVVFEHQD